MISPANFFLFYTFSFIKDGVLITSLQPHLEKNTAYLKMVEVIQTILVLVEAEDLQAAVRPNPTWKK
jgi:hypothetical protein